MLDAFGKKENREDVERKIERDAPETDPDRRPRVLHGKEGRGQAFLKAEGEHARRVGHDSQGGEMCRCAVEFSVRPYIEHLH